MAIAICGVRVWDGTAISVPPDRLTIRIEHGRIAAIGAGPELSDDADVIAFDAELRSDARAVGVPTAIPGLIDAHVHLTLDPAIADPRRQLEVSREELETALCSRARAMLRAGITTARDLGGGAWHEIALRDRTLRGEVAGPRLLCAGQPVTSPGGHCCFWGGEASDVAAIRSVVRRQIDRGADWVKVMATGGVMTGNTGDRSPRTVTGRAGSSSRLPRGREPSSTAHSRARTASGAISTPASCAGSRRARRSGYRRR
jgi:imidazolonepropionase-like amidohydrolase